MGLKWNATLVSFTNDVKSRLKKYHQFERNTDHQQYRQNPGVKNRIEEPYDQIGGKGNDQRKREVIAQ